MLANDFRRFHGGDHRVAVAYDNPHHAAVMNAPRFDLARFAQAHARIVSAVHRTPMLRSQTLSDRVGAPVYLKCENLQKTGAFKVRGALHRLLRLSDEQRARGVATISAGNHAQAVAWAATAVGIRSLVVMPEKASRTKVQASREYGAEVILHGDAQAAFTKVLELSEERGMTFVHPFDDEEVVAGHGSCGLEIVDQLPDVHTIVVPVGGGGLASAIAASVAAAKPGVAVWGVEPEGAPSMHRSLEAGEAIHLQSVSTVADGLAPPMAGVLNHALLAAHAQGVVLVSDEEIISALRVILERTKLLVEPSGAAAVAALLEGRIPVEPEQPVVAVLSGGNVDLASLGELLSEGNRLHV